MRSFAVFAFVLAAVLALPSFAQDKPAETPPADAKKAEGDKKEDPKKKDDKKDADKGKSDDKKDADKDKEAKLNAKCPVSGDDADSAITTKYEGRSIAFCCEDCEKDFKKDPKKYIAKLDEKKK